MENSTRLSGYRFASFALDLRSGDLSQNGTRIHLQEKPCNLLAALLEHPGDVVTRAELREHLWPDDTFVDFEDGLNTAMRKLREALNDHPQSPRYIETVRGRGYRFVAKVEPLAGRNGFPAEREIDTRPAPDGPDIVKLPITASPMVQQPRSHRGLILWSFLLGCGLAAGSGMAWHWLSQANGVLHSPAISRRLLPISKTKPGIHGSTVR